MRFSIFELLAWITFLTILCAVLFRGSHGEALIVVAWTVVVILTLNFFGRRASLTTSFLTAFGLSVYSAYWLSYGLSRSVIPPKDPFPIALIFSGFFLGAFAVLLWAIIIAVDALIAAIQRRIMRRPTDGTYE